MYICIQISIFCRKGNSNLERISGVSTDILKVDLTLGNSFTILSRFLFFITMLEELVQLVYWRIGAFYSTQYAWKNAEDISR